MYVSFFSLIRFLYRVTGNLLMDRLRRFFSVWYTLVFLQPLTALIILSLLISDFMSLNHLGYPTSIRFFLYPIHQCVVCMHLCMYVCVFCVFVCVNVCMSSPFCCLICFCDHAVHQAWDPLIFLPQSQLTTGAWLLLFWRVLMGSREMGWQLEGKVRSMQSCFHMGEIFNVWVLI